jgi:alkylation response protein AidB-like acyl-CoA dehydrogenase
MSPTLSDEQEMLRATARRFLEEKAPSSEVRRLMEIGEGFDPDLWDAIAEQGWQSMALPEEYQGFGASFLETAILMEEMGRALFPAPYLSTVVLGADLILGAGSPAQKRELLPSIASGRRRVALAHLEEHGRWGPSGIGMTEVRDGGDLVLTGVKRFVLDGHTADTLIVVTREAGSEASRGVSLVVVDAEAPGVRRRRLETLDMTRPQAELVFDGVRVPASAVLGEAGEGWAGLERTLTRAAAALAFEQVGGAERCLEMAVDYARLRMQFGRPIGSFQAVKHRCADMLVRVESARSSALAAGRAIAVDDRDELDLAAPIAKAHCSEAFTFCAAENIQVHGGIGFTWEHDAHLYFRRAKTDELLFGSPARHRAILAERLGI